MSNKNSDKNSLLNKNENSDGYINKIIDSKRVMFSVEANTIKKKKRPKMIKTTSSNRKKGD